MNSIRRLPILAAALVFSVSFARGQEVAPNLSARAGRIANWPAPAFWSPSGRAMDSLGERGEVGIQASTSPLPFIGVTPCRLLDTRPPVNNPLDGDGIYGADEIRTYTLPGACGLPGTMQAVSLNVTVTNTGSGAFGHIKIWPGDQAEPNVSTLNYPGAGATLANAAVVPLSAMGALSVKSGNASADVILDVNGYYAAAGVSNANTFLGTNAGNFTMSGCCNTAVGSGAFVNNETGHDNTAFGVQALFSNTAGHSNTATGVNALLLNTTGNANTATGKWALLNNTFGGSNTASGYNALLANTSGSDNTAIGFEALAQNTTGWANTAIGRYAGRNLSTGHHNIAIGNVGVAGEAATIRIGTEGNQTRVFLAGVRGVTAGVNDAIPVVIDSAGQLGAPVTFSSRRVKEAIEGMGDKTDRLLRLRPVMFRYKPELDPTGIVQYGLIAEEVAEVFPELVVYDRDGRPETVRYQLINALLLNEVQRQHRTVEAQEKAIEAQEKAINQQKETIDHEQAEIEALKARVNRLEARLDSRP